MANILIVDDEEADLLYLQAILAHAGHDTSFAQDGAEAIKRFNEGGIDVVVTDLHMPEVHGFELISVLREMLDPPVVIAVSGTGPFQLHMAEALGARETLQKPVDPELLLASVDRAIEARANPSTGEAAEEDAS